MEEASTPPKLMDERLGHEDGSVQARYSHVTPRMGARLMDALTEQWEKALDVRRAMSHGSPVAALDALLRARKRSHPDIGEHEPARARPVFGLVTEPTGASGDLLFVEPQLRSLNPRSLHRPKKPGTVS